MNILFVSLRGPTNENRRGGAQDYIQYISAPWVRQGHNITILCSQELLDGVLLPDSEQVDGIEIIRVGSPRHRIIPLLMETRRRFDATDIVIDNIMGFPLFLPLIVKPVPLLAIKHHFEGKSFTKSQGLIKGAIGRFLEEIMQPLIYRKVPFVVVSTITLDEINNKWIKPRAEIRIIPPGITPFQLDENIKKYPDPTVIYYGALDTGRKKVDHLISAFRKVHEKLPDSRLIIGGQGPDTEMLKQMAAGLPVDFKGFITEAEKSEMLQRGWIFASPSMTEGFGITWVEANSAGLPVVGYDLGLDTVNTECSIMVEKGNVSDLAAAMIRILSNEALRNAMSLSSKKNARRFDWGKSSCNIMNFINDVK